MEVNDVLSQVSPSEASAGISKDAGALPSVPRAPAATAQPQEPQEPQEPQRDLTIKEEALGTFSEPENDDISEDEIDSLLGDVVEDQDIEVNEFTGGNTQDATLRYQRLQALDTDKAKSKEVLFLEARTKLPRDFISENIELARELHEEENFNDTEFRKNSPVFSLWAAENPSNFRVIQDDINSLSYGERNLRFIKSQTAIGNAQAEISRIGINKIDGIASKGDLEKLVELEKEIERLGSFDYDINGFVEGIPGAVANSLPLMLDAGFSAATGFGQGAAVGAGLGLAGATPFSVGGGALAGGSLLGSARFISRNMMTQAGLVIHDYEKITFQDGERIRPETAKAMALSVGILSGAVESFGSGILFKQFPFLKSFTATGMKKLALQPGVRGAFQRIATALGTGALSEGLTEGVQELVQIAGQEITEMGASGNEVTAAEFLNRAFSDENLKTIAESARGGAQGGIGFSSAGSISSEAQNFASNRKAKNANDSLDKSIDGLKDTDLIKDHPEQAEVLLRRQIENTDAEAVQVDAEKITELFQTADPDKDVAEQVEEFYGEEAANSYREALENGGDVIIPTEKYLIQAALSDDLREGLKDHVVANTDGVSNEEVTEFFQSVKDDNEKKSEAIKKLEAGEEIELSEIDSTENELQRVEIQDQLSGQLQAAGQVGPQVDANASILAAGFTTLAERTGRTPKELFEKYNVTINQSEGLQGRVFNQKIDDNTLRALEQGFSEDIVYHGTDSDFEEFTPSRGGHFGPGIYVFKESVKDSSFNFGDRQLALRVKNKKNKQVKLVPDLNQSDIEEIKSEILELGGDPKIADEIFSKKDKTAFVARNSLSIYISALRERPNDNSVGNETFIELAKFFESKGFTGYDAFWNDKPIEVIFDPKNVRSIDARFDADKSESTNIFDQESEGTKRGRILISKKNGQKQFNIDLLEAADQSTFVHESGHLYFELLADLAAEKDAPQDIKDDFQTLLDFVGVESIDQVGVEQHEKLANGFMNYVGEGKAPSPALRKAFSNFKKWFLGLFKSIDAQNIQLTPEVRDVFDRMLASEKQIEAAYQEQAADGLFDQTSDLGFTETQERKYLEAIGATKLEAEEKLTARELKKLENKRNARLGKYKRDATNLVNNIPIYNVIANISTGKFADGSEVSAEFENLKFDTDLAEQAFGKEFLKGINRRLFKRDGTGLDPDTMAVVFGYDSGTQLITDIKNAKPKKDMIADVTDQLIRESEPELLEDIPKYEDALDLVHNDKRAELLRLELELLAKNEFTTFKGVSRKLDKKIPSSKEIKAKAAETIGIKRVRDIKPLTFSRAERRYAKKAREQFSKGDIEAAFNSKRKELINHELYREAKRVSELNEKSLRKLKRFEKTSIRSRIGKADDFSLENLDALLAKVSIKNISGAEIDRRANLGKWLEKQQNLGLIIDIPKKVRDQAERIHYRDLSQDDFQNIVDTAEKIAFVALNKEKLLFAAKLRNFAETKDSILGSIQENHAEALARPDTVDFEGSTFTKRLVANTKNFFAKHTKLEFLFENLDGNNALGPVWKAVFRPFNDAEANEVILRDTTSRKLEQIMSVYKGKERSDFNKKSIFIPELGIKMTKEKLFTMALNFGNAENIVSLTEGYGWDKATIEKVLNNNLDKRDWDAVQQIWDHVDSFWPSIADLERKMNGIVPRKVEAQAVSNSHGEFKGGYYPISFDGTLSYEQSVFDEKQNLKDFGGGAVKAATAKGHTKERVGSGGKPINLSFDVLNKHLGNVIHDLTHREAIVDASRLTSDPDIRAAITKVAGLEMYKQINPWLQGIARDGYDKGGGLDGFFSTIRKGSTVVNLGFKLTTALVQPLGLTVSAKELGLKYTMKGMRATFTKDKSQRRNAVKQTIDFINERSNFMKDRQDNFDRDIRDGFKRLRLTNPKSGPMAELANYMGFEQVSDMLDSSSAKVSDMTNMYFNLIGYGDMAVSVPTWMGAYQKAMDGNVSNIEKGSEQDAVDFADGIVRKTQGSGGPKDLSNIQNGSQAMRLFTMFYSYFSVLFNQFQKSGQDFNKTKDFTKLGADLAFLWIMPVVLEKLLLNRGPEEDEEAIPFWIKEVGFYPLNGLVGVRDISNSLLNPQFGFQGSPAFGAAETMIKGSSAIAKGIFTEDELTRADARNIVIGTAYATPFPGRQAWLTGESLYDWMTGEDVPDSVLEGIYRSAVTRKKDK